MSTQRTARLRVCASCEWIYNGHGMCPKCGFASYSARSVYGITCYRYRTTQEPWYNRMMAAYSVALRKQINTPPAGEVTR